MYLAENNIKDSSIVFMKPTITTREVRSVLECMIQDEISFGQVVRNFEQECASAFGFKKALSALSLHSAYHLAFLSMEIKEGDEIILPANAPVAALDAIGYLNAKPVLVDIEREGYHASPEQICQKISPKTKAVILSYPYGAFKNYNDLRSEFQAERKIKIIEDISEIAGQEFDENMIGAASDIAIISFHEDMIMTMGKGAVFLTNSNRAYSIAKDLRMHGSSRTYRVRYDYTITDYQAAIGLEQLNNLTAILERRKKIGAVYIESISKSYLNAYFKFSGLDTYAAFPIVSAMGLTHCLKYFKLRNIEVRKLSNKKPLHHLLGLPISNFPNIEKLYQRGIFIPIYPYLTKRGVERISSAIRGFI